MTTFVIAGGDLLKAARSYNLIHAFAHGANCWSTMGSGIAGFIARDFPALYRADANDPRGPEQRLGGMSYAYDYDNGCWGFNLYTQFYPGPNARMPSIISSVQVMMEQIHDILEANQDEDVLVGFPAIGCGIGGLVLSDVVRAVEAVSQSIFEDTKRRVIPVFYIMEVDKFKSCLRELTDDMNESIVVVSSEQEVKEANVRI